MRWGRGSERWGGRAGRGGGSGSSQESRWFPQAWPRLARKAPGLGLSAQRGSGLGPRRGSSGAPRPKAALSPRFRRGPAPPSGPAGVQLTCRPRAGLSAFAAEGRKRRPAPTALHQKRVTELRSPLLAAPLTGRTRYRPGATQAQRWCRCGVALCSPQVSWQRCPPQTPPLRALVGVGGRRSSSSRTDGVGLVSASRLGKGTKRRLDELSKGEMEWPYANRIQETVLKRERFFHYVLSVHLFFLARGSVELSPA